ncbi:MAG: hypothetical protein PW734_12355 [Verrucomicrobium sp.]|nr:hypothetical protein [Verrucomicrobium sp.]
MTMRTFAELRTHLREVTGRDDLALNEAEWSRYDGNAEGRPGGWVHRDARVEPGVEIGEDAAVYGEATVLRTSTVVGGDSIIGPMVDTSGSVLIADGAHVTGASQEKPDLLYPTFLRDGCQILGPGTWVAQSELAETTVRDGAWVYQSRTGNALISDPATAVIRTSIGQMPEEPRPEDPDLPPGGEEERNEPELTQILNGAQLIRCAVGPGVIIDLPVFLRDRTDLAASNPHITAKETLSQLHLDEFYDLEEEEEEPPRFEEADFTSSRKRGKGAKEKEKEKGPYKM